MIGMFHLRRGKAVNLNIMTLKIMDLKVHILTLKKFIKIKTKLHINQNIYIDFNYTEQ